MQCKCVPIAAIESWRQINHQYWWNLPKILPSSFLNFILILSWMSVSNKLLGSGTAFVSIWATNFSWCQLFYHIVCLSVCMALWNGWHNFYGILYLIWLSSLIFKLSLASNPNRFNEFSLRHYCIFSDFQFTNI